MAEMTLPAAFSSLPHSEFNEFLFAPIGEEGNGMLLSVISALARLGVDPWEEAARLSDLSKGAAAQALAPMIARLPGGRWKLSDAQGIAARLVELLPEGGSDVRPAQAGYDGRARINFRTAAIWLICLALGAAALFGMATNGKPQSGDDRALAPVSSAVSPQPGRQ